MIALGLTKRGASFLKNTAGSGQNERQSKTITFEGHRLQCRILRPASLSAKTPLYVNVECCRGADAGY